MIGLCGLGWWMERIFSQETLCIWLCVCSVCALVFVCNNNFCVHPPAGKVDYKQTKGVSYGLYLHWSHKNEMDATVERLA